MTLPLQSRRLAAQNIVARSLFSLMEQKQSNLALALDITEKEKFFDILESVAKHIVVLKTHIDIIDDFDQKFIKQLMIFKEKYNFLIFEDRKFADIPNTVKLQYTKGAHHIIDWADIVNAHIFGGQGIIEGLRQAWKESQFHRGLVLLPQMTSAGNLFNKEIMIRAIEWAKEYCDFVIGFIGAPSLNLTFAWNSADLKEKTIDYEGYQSFTEESASKLKLGKDNNITIKEASLRSLRKCSWPEFLIFTPGVRINKMNKETQDHRQYVLPKEAIEQGSDIIIVGRGIYDAEDPEESARIYKEEAWRAFLK